MKLLLLLKSLGTLAVPGAGPILGALSAVWNAICALVRAIFEGIAICLANPVVFLVIAIAFGAGGWMGIDWDRHKVVQCRAKAANDLGICTRRFTQLEEELSRRHADIISGAKTAAAEASVPAGQSEVAALCQRSASCRDRGAK